MKTVELLECRTCNGTYYAGDKDVTLKAGDERTLPDELYIAVRKVRMCASCKQREDRSLSGKRKRFNQ
jgi:hypothetical protein